MTAARLEDAQEPGSSDRRGPMGDRRRRRGRPGARLGGPPPASKTPRSPARVTAARLEDAQEPGSSDRRPPRRRPGARLE